MSMTKLTLGAMAAGCFFLAGCIVRERPVYYSSPPPPPGAVAPQGEVVTEEAPPPDQVEIMPVAPGPEVDFLWIPGWWYWGGGHWLWRGGYWGHRPHPGAMWVPHAWVRGPHGHWVHGGGHWR
jgi:hypothetical protein